MQLLPPTWEPVFTLETPLFELIARGSVLYAIILVLMRVMPRRTGGELATMDLVFVVLIAQAAATALGDYTSVADAAVVVTTFMVWNYLLNALSFRFRAVERLVSARPLPIVRDGRLLWRNMRSEFITEGELMDHLRRTGIEDVSEVHAAYVEGEGRITVVPRRVGGRKDGPH